MYKSLFTILIVLGSVLFQESILFAQTSGTTNPIMVIRCRFDNTEAAVKEDNSKVDDPCPESGLMGNIQIPDGSGGCTDLCFSGEVTATFPTLDCDAAVPGELINVTMCFKGGGGEDLPDGIYISFEEIQNCLNPDDQEEWFASAVALGSLEEYVFGPSIGGQVCANFAIDPFADVVLDNESPAGTQSFAPCSTIPTMNQWGLLILGLITSCLALGYMLIRRKHLV